MALFTPARQFMLLLFLAGSLLLTIRPWMVGDIDEYAAMTIALAEHGTPDIRIADLEKARSLLPQLASFFDTNIEGMRSNLLHPKAGFHRGLDGSYYAIHFFAYSALAVLPFKALEAIGLSPLKCYQIVNLTFVFLLGLTLHRVFNSDTRALAGLGLFLLCGGLYYWNWSSPECMSAAALLTGMLLFAGNAPIRAGMITGLAAMQNPPVVFLLAFAPLLHLCIHYRHGIGWRDNLANSLTRDTLIGLGIGGTLFALPVLFNLLTFGEPSVLATVATDFESASLYQLYSFFLDLNQGMIIGIPGVLLALALWGWRNQSPGHLGAEKYTCAIQSRAGSFCRASAPR